MTVASTQDEARSKLETLPVAVASGAQTHGRGRSGSGWLNADRAMAVSIALRRPGADQRPFSLMAGVAAARTVPGTGLEWPNDVILDGAKAGGILVERSGDILVIGLGLNLWWESPPAGMGCLYEEDPGPDRFTEVAAMWTAGMMRLVDEPGWPRDEYRSLSLTIGEDITWEPHGSGRATDVADDGSLLVDLGGTEEPLYSGAVRKVRRG